MTSSLLTQEQSEVNDFLDSVGRNSAKTKKLYGFSLLHFQEFLSSDDRYSKFTANSILKPLSKNQIDAYTLIDHFVSYLVSKHNKKLSPNSISLYVAALRSYLLYHNIDIVVSKFKRRVKLPKKHKEDEEALDASDIRKILLSCNNRRLKAYLLTLASGGMRAIEAIAIRNSDIDFSVSPTKVHIRADFAKTRVSRDVYVSDETSKFLKEWLDFKYRDKGEPLKRMPSDLVFGKRNQSSNINFIYQKLWYEFTKILEVISMNERKEGMNRRKFTFHSFRRNAYTTICDVTDQAFAEYFLGHSKSVYHTKKESSKREIYANKIMKYLTFLDYTTLESTGRNIEAKLEEKEKEISYLRERDLKHDTEMADMRVTLDKIVSLIKQNPKLAKVKTDVLSNL
jgi:integrase